MREISTRLANGGDLDAVARLFDGYRQFYGKTSNVEGAEAFLGARIAASDSTIIVAEQAGDVVGFTQLYPSFTSVGMARIFILNDVFVASESRGTGAGRALLDAAAHYAREAGAVRLTLTTQVTNARAQSVYEANGWVRDDQFYTYNLSLTG